MMTSASMPIGVRDFADPFHYFFKQGFAACLGLIVGFLFFLIPTNFWEKLGILTALIAIGLLALVYIPGIGLEANGATRWVDIGPLPTIQVIDPARFFLIIYIAGYCFRQQKQVEMTFLSLIKLMIFILPACILLLLQPDFGATVVLLAIVASLFFVAGFKFKYFFVLLAALASVFWLLVYKVQYRLDRVTSFLDPWADPLGDSYQLVNSLIAIGSGEWFGVGLGESVQKLGYLPEAHTDFIFAVIAEELIFGKDSVTTGASNDIARATEIARNMVTKWGLSDKLGPLSYSKDEEEIFLGRSVTQHKQVSDTTVNIIIKK